MLHSKLCHLFSTEGKKTRPTDGAELHVLIKEAKNLTAMKAGGTCDSFVKGFANICFVLEVPCLFISTNSAVFQVSAAIKEKVFLKAEDSGSEEDEEPKLQPHICVQPPESGAAEGCMSGAHRLGQRDAA